jgi:hypothetical protein
VTIREPSARFISHAMHVSYGTSAPSNLTAPQFEKTMADFIKFVHNQIPWAANLLTRYLSGTSDVTLTLKHARVAMETLDQMDFVFIMEKDFQDTQLLDWVGFFAHAE